jgi:hypothetical protein
MIINQISDTWSTAGVKEWGAIWLGMMPCDDKARYKIFLRAKKN